MSKEKAGILFASALERSKAASFGIPFILKLLFPFFIGAAVIQFLGHSPVEAYTALFRGAFYGTFNLGTTLERFTPIFLTALAFCIATKVSYINMGVEGCFNLGALAAAGAGFLIIDLPWFIHLPVCLLLGLIVGSIWAVIPGYLRAYWRVNELCSALLLNFVAFGIVAYMIAVPWSAMGAASQTVPILDTARLTRIMWPSRANTGIFIAIAVYFFVYWMLQKTTFGFRMRSCGINPIFSNYIGVDAKRMVVFATLFSGGIGGLAGAIQTTGVFGTIIHGFSADTAFDGMLASLIAKNKMQYLPIYSFMIAALKVGALGMERHTGVPRALIDTLVPMLIILINMDVIFNFKWKNVFKGKKPLAAGG